MLVVNQNPNGFGPKRRRTAAGISWQSSILRIARALFQPFGWGGLLLDEFTASSFVGPQTLSHIESSRAVVMAAIAVASLGDLRGPIVLNLLDDPARIPCHLFLRFKFALFTPFSLFPLPTWGREENNEKSGLRASPPSIHKQRSGQWYVYFTSGGCVKQSGRLSNCWHQWYDACNSRLKSQFKWPLLRTVRRPCVMRGLMSKWAYPLSSRYRQLLCYTTRCVYCVCMSTDHIQYFCYP